MALRAHRRREKGFALCLCWESPAEKRRNQSFYHSITITTADNYSSSHLIKAAKCHPAAAAATSVLLFLLITFVILVTHAQFPPLSSATVFEPLINGQIGTQLKRYFMFQKYPLLICNCCRRRLGSHATHTLGGNHFKTTRKKRD